MALLACSGAGLAQTQQEKASPTATDPGWPREVTKDGAVLTYYQPQIDGWKDYKELAGRVAFSLTPKGGKPVIGVASLKAKTQTDKDAGLVVIKSIEVVQTRFPALDTAGVNQSDKLFRQLFPTAGMTVSLDRIVAGAEKGETGAKPVSVRTEPPPIFVSEQPAILLFVDGDPVRVPVDSTSSLAFIVNTNWTLFHDSGTDHYYLLDDMTWQSAPQLKGPWAATTLLPKSFADLPAGEEFADVRQALPATKPTTAVKPIFYTAKPGELIEFSGRPVYAEIPQTRLLYAKNTENDLFVHKDQSQYYLLLSGRWFRAKSLQGPWAYAGDDLPGDFAKIPPASQKSAVLASVPGTQEAADAVLLAEIPTTAVVNRAEAEKNVKVVYDGPPKFSPVEKTSVSYATNTESKVILADGKYYLCYQGVWFVSSSSGGPWKTADMIPASIYTIPPSSPVHNVTYVTVVEPTPTTVTTSYTSGYTGVFIMGMVVGAAVVYGSGYYYPPYMYRPPYGYPVYRPYPYTYSAGARYNPYTGGYAVGRSAYGPYGAAGQAAWYNPSTGRYGRAATVQTPYGGRTAATSYNPYTGVRASTRQGSSPYGQWGSTAVQRGNDWAVSNRVTNSQGTVRHTTTSSGAQGATYRGRDGQTTRVATDGNNNVYAGHDGNVYKKDASGGWQKYDNGGWSGMDQSGNRPSQQPGTGASTRPSTQPTNQRPNASASQQPSGGVPRDVQRDASSRQRGSDRAGYSARQGGGARPSRRR